LLKFSISEHNPALHLARHLVCSSTETSSSEVLLKYGVGSDQFTVYINQQS